MFEANPGGAPGNVLSMLAKLGRQAAFNMVFQFEHVELDYAADGSKWSGNRVPLAVLKNTMSRWQTVLHGKVWNSLYWGNHDQPRVVSRMGNDQDALLWEKSAKMLATCLYMMQGTPYIYQGEELGMTNFPFTDISQFHDIESINAYRDYTRERGVDPQTVLGWLRSKSRDNARSPMQWNDRANAGFTTGAPWFSVNPNYSWINAERQLCDKDSVYRYYQRLLRLRKSNPIILHGSFALHMPEHTHIFAYTRHYAKQVLGVLCNFSEGKQDIVLPQAPVGSAWKLLLGNYPMEGNKQAPELLILEPFEAVVLISV